MLVQRVISPASPLESWTVLGEDDAPVAPSERYLAYLTDIERSPNTIKAYAHDLKDWFTFLGGRDLDWREVRLEDLGEFVAWLRLSPPARDGQVVVLPSVEHHCAESTVNRKLAALSAFYTHAGRHGVDVGELLVTWQPVGRRGSGWRPFLQHISKGEPTKRRTIALKAPKKLPRVLAAGEASQPHLPSTPIPVRRRSNTSASTQAPIHAIARAAAAVGLTQRPSASTATT